MRVVTLASRKGGAGKTTLAGHLAVEAERCGVGPVALVDLDPQGSLSSWWNLREAETPHFASLNAARLDEGLQSLRESGMKLVVIDTPPTLSPVVARAISCAHFVLVPLRPSPHDLRSVGATLDMIEDLGRPYLFVLNAATNRSRLIEESRTVLAGQGPVARTVVHARVDFAASMVDGRVVGEVGGALRSPREIQNLWREVEERLPKFPRVAALTGHMVQEKVDLFEQPDQHEEADDNITYLRGA